MRETHVGRRAVLIGMAIAVAGASLILSGAAVQNPGAGAARHSPAAHRLAALPAGARAIVARQLGAADRHFWVHRTATSATFDDSRTGISAVASRQGVVIRTRALAWSLGLRAWGRGAQLERAAAAAPVAHANEVTFGRTVIHERYDYGPLGLEQGFTISRRPAGPAGAAAVLALGDTPRGLDPVVARNGRSMALTRGGRTVLRYWGLFASDARGRSLPARIVVSGRALSLQVDDRGARYPVRVDPFVQVAKLSASDAAASDEMGTSIAVAGDTIVAGVWRATVGGNAGQGAVYVFVKPNGGWASGNEVAKLTASDGAANDNLGWSVAISPDGGTILAGAPGANAQQGAAYVFLKPNGGWASEPQAARLTNSAGAAGDRFGVSVATRSDAAVVGVPFEGNGLRANDGGSVYVFAEPVGGWSNSGTPTARLTGSDATGADAVGFSVAIDGDTLAAGAEHQDSGGNTEVGALYVFVEPPGGWVNATETKKLTASDGATANQLGYSVAIAGDTIVAGAPFPSGAAYVFVKPANGWASASGHESAKLTPSDPNDGFGRSTGISGDTIVVGSPAVAVEQASNQGKLYEFAKPGGGWASGHETQQMTASDGAASDALGYSTGVSGGTIAAGAPGTNGNAGATYVFSSTVQATTTTTVGCQPGTAAVGSATTCTATVASAGATAPTGSVGFASDSSGTFDSGGSCTLAATGNPGEASCHVGYTPIATGSGTHRITATYGGDGAHGGSSGNTNVTVTGGAGGGKRPTLTSVLFCFPATVTVGTSASCRATVTDTGNGPAVTPTGTVSFGSDSHGTFAGSSCTLTAVNTATSGCNVVYTPSAVDSGGHTLTAAYGGDAIHASSSGRTTLTVRPRAPTPPQNTALPSIAADKSCQIFNGRPYCQVIPYEYVCYPGQWAGNDPSSPYQYQWQQLYNMRQGFGLIPFWRNEPSGTGQSFYAQTHLNRSDLARGITASGTYRCLVTASGPGGSAQADSPATRLQVAPSSLSAFHPAPVDIHVTGIEVTQGVQEAPCAGCVFSDSSHTPCATCAASTLPSRDQTNGDTPGSADYSGVTMSAGKQTVVRVYANVTRVAASFAGATAQLEVFDSNGHRILLLNPAVNQFITPGALQLPSGACPLCVDLATRAKPASSYYFVIPGQYTYHRDLTFRATVTPPVGPLLPGQCSGCNGNVFALHHVPFKQAATVTIWPIKLDDAGVPGDPTTALSQDQIFGSMETVYPNPVRVLPWDGNLDVEAMTTDDATEAVEDRAEDNDLTPFVYPVGVFFQGESGGLGGSTPNGPGRLFTDDGPPVSIVEDDRPLTAVAHEIGHGMALGHADNSTPHPDGTANCGGGLNNQAGEGWPPDYEGRIQGVGLDLRGFNPLRPGSLPAPFVEGYDHAGNTTSSRKTGAQYFDFMSYCPCLFPPPSSPGACPKGGVFLGNLVNGQYQESLYWISAHNWQRLLDYHAPPQALPAADARTRGAPGTPLRVVATVYPGGATRIHEVTPGARVKLGPTPGTPFRIELRDAGGKLLTSVVPSAVTIHTDGAGADQGLMLSATLPFPAAAKAVVITAAGQEVARRTRSAHAPTARLASPRPGILVGRTPTTIVRWTAHDADGDRLTADVDYSATGGRTWRVLASNLRRTSARIPSRLLSISRNARVRVRISDGFNLTTVTSGRLRARGAPPSVQIMGAPRRAEALETQTLPLQGSAFDDADRPLTGRHLSWYLGKRLIGHGELATARRLPTGTTTIRLVATDTHGRKGQAILPLHVKAVAARYLLFDAPLLVSPKSRAVRIRVASSAPATFTIGGKRYRVTTKPRTITVALRRGNKMIRLPCSLRSPGGMIRSRYLAVR